LLQIPKNAPPEADALQQLDYVLGRLDLLVVECPDELESCLLARSFADL